MYKTITGIIVVLSLILSGCSMIPTIKDDDAEVVALISIRIASRELAKEICERGHCTDKVVEIAEIIDVLMAETRKGNKEVFNLAELYLLSLCPDEDLRLDFADLVELMNLTGEPEEILDMQDDQTDLYMRRMQYALQGFKQGIKKKE